MSETKMCPFCAEQIQKKATICKHCKKELPDSQYEQIKQESSFLVRVFKRWYIHLFLFPISLPIEYLAFMNQPDQIKMRQEKAEKEKTHVDSLPKEEREIHSKEKDRKWKVKIFWIIFVVIAISFYSLSEESPWMSWLGFLVLFVGVWLYPGEGEESFFKNRLGRLKQYKGRIASNLTFLALTLFIFVPLMSEALEEQRLKEEKEFIENYPAPTIEVLSSMDHQGDAKEYELKVKVENASSVSADYKDMVQDSKNQNLYHLTIPLDLSEESILIQAENEHKEAEEKLVITRTETEQEKEERLAREAKEAEKLAQKEAQQKALEEQKKKLEAYGTGGKETEAYVCSKNDVKDSLASPSTADFPFLEFTSFYVGYNKYRVESYVDSQNGFGAMVRTNYRCIVEVIDAKNFICTSQCEFF